jgi:hypothetical protein
MEKSTSIAIRWWQSMYTFLICTFHLYDICMQIYVHILDLSSSQTSKHILNLPPFVHKYTNVSYVKLLYVYTFFLLLYTSIEFYEQNNMQKIKRNYLRAIIDYNYWLEICLRLFTSIQLLIRLHFHFPAFTIHPGFTIKEFH